MIWMEAYHHWRPLLIEALDGRYFNGEWLDCQVMSGRAVFWHDDDCALVAELRFYPTGARDVAVHCAAGDPIKTRDTMLPRLKAMAVANRCLAVVVSSREAWLRLLSGSGFELYKTELRKALADG